MILPHLIERILIFLKSSVCEMDIDRSGVDRFMTEKSFESQQVYNRSGVDRFMTEKSFESQQVYTVFIAVGRKCMAEQIPNLGFVPKSELK